MDKDFNNILLKELENRINNGKKIILFSLNNTEMLAALTKRCEVYADSIEIWTHIETHNDGIVLRKLSTDELEVIKRAFFTYEFTDKVLFVGTNCTFPSMNNYVQQGILTEDELVDALLYKIG